MRFLTFARPVLTSGYPLRLKTVLMERYDRVAIKNGQEHCLTSSERGDRSIQSGHFEWTYLRAQIDRKSTRLNSSH